MEKQIALKRIIFFYIPVYLTTYLKERDSVEATLKLLQARGGIAKEEMADESGVTGRAVSNIFRSISPEDSLKTEDRTPTRMVGCDVISKIVESKRAGSHKTDYRRTVTKSPGG